LSYVGNFFIKSWIFFILSLVIIVAGLSFLVLISVGELFVEVNLFTWKSIVPFHLFYIGPLIMLLLGIWALLYSVGIKLIEQ